MDLVVHTIVMDATGGAITLVEVRVVPVVARQRVMTVLAPHCVIETIIVLVEADVILSVMDRVLADVVHVVAVVVELVEIVLEHVLAVVLVPPGKKKQKVFSCQRQENYLDS